MKNSFYFIYSLVFLLGGAIQLMDIASNTTMTISLTLSMLIIPLFTKKIVIGIPYFILLILILLVSIYRESSLFLTVLYVVLFVCIPFASINFISNIYKYVKFKSIYKLLIFTGLIQFPLILIQRTIYPYIGFTHNRIREIDIGFGSFFLANDHGLCFFILCMISYILFYKKKTKKNILLLLWFSLTIFIANSNISIILLLFIYGMYFYHINRKQFIRFTLYLVFFCIILGTLYYTNSYIQDKMDFIYERGINKDVSSFDNAIDGGYADRFDIIKYYSEQKFKITGEGPFSYWSPLTKIFSKFTNYSQYLWFYNDLGIFSIFIIILIYYKQSKIRWNIYNNIICILILIYSFFTNTLSDLAFNLTFAMFVLKK